MRGEDRYDALIVGARVAGAALATLLGRAGYRVLLVDRARFPSPTLSTHYFRGAGMVAVLDRLGLLDQVRALGSPPLVQQYLYTGGAAAATVASPQEPGEIGYSLSVRRAPLDDLLVRHAAACPTVELRERTRFLGPLWRNGRVVGARLATPAGARSAHARIVVGADGRHSAVARAVGAPVETTDPPLRALYYQYVRGFPGPDGATPNGAEFSRLADEMAYVFPSDDGMTCVALSVNLSDFAHLRTAPDEHFRRRIGADRGFAARSAATAPEEKLLGCGPEPSYVRVPVGPGWALVGDAGLHQDPWSGRGMDLAALHATYLAEALLTWFGGSNSETQAMATYHARRNAHGLPIYQRTVTLARDLRQMG